MTSRHSRRLFLLLAALTLVLWCAFPLLAAASGRTDPVTGMEFVFVEGGSYRMGNFTGLGIVLETPAHPVAVSDFYLGRYEVTVGQFRAYTEQSGYLTAAERAGGVIDIDPAMGTIVKRAGISWKSPGFEQEETDPVVWVNWDDAAAFTAWLAARTSLPYRLPTEAEWEFAARERGAEVQWAGTSELDALGRFAWYSANSGGRPHEVGGKSPNSLGLHDMSGNVWEWCIDWQDRYPSGDTVLQDPRGDSPRGLRAIRGGSWRVDEATLTTTYRNGYKTGYAHSSIGFRVALPAADLTASLPRAGR